VERFFNTDTYVNDGYREAIFLNENFIEWNANQKFILNKYLEKSTINFYENVFLDVSQIAFMDFSEEYEHYHAVDT